MTILIFQQLIEGSFVRAHINLVKKMKTDQTKSTIFSSSSSTVTVSLSSTAPSSFSPPSSTPLFRLQPLSHPAPLTIPTVVAAILTSDLCLLCNTSTTSYFLSQICASHPTATSRRRQQGHELYLNPHRRRLKRAA